MKKLIILIVLFFQSLGAAAQETDLQALFTAYLQRAQQGDSTAQANLGVLYLEGRGVQANAQKAAQWFHQAAQQGHTLAQYNLGVLYRQGRGVTQDDQQALKWFRKAAGQGYHLAQNNLA
ncbi:MAG: tetratricopeptide repeat protein, partial [Pseudomonadota bacterium]|nr:tetratricopeptide repeat protein [Pseudomonadota bacterium]